MDYSCEYFFVSETIDGKTYRLSSHQRERFLALNHCPFQITHFHSLHFKLLPTMAAALVGGALLSAFLQVAFDKLTSPQLLDFFRGRKLDEKLLANLNIKLHSINALADDAELKQFTDPHVKAWLDSF